MLSLPRTPRLIHCVRSPPSPRKRKLQQDPNNTRWTRNENTFGQKILRASGWQPGQYLGAQDAPHSELHTAANASYIRVSLKDDMKGLGFDKAMRDDEVTGLDVFNDLLSRLNGKSEAVVEEQKKARLVVKTHRFVEQRYGAMRFVRGGLLVGDELKADDNSAKKEEEEKKVNEEDGEKKASKKRKATSLEEGEDESASAAEPESKKKRKKDEKKSSKKRSADVSSDETPSTETDSKTKRKDKKSKKDKSVKSEAEDDVDMDEAPKKSISLEQSDDSEPSSKPKKSKEERKEEKRLKKLRKEEKKEAKRRKKAEAKASSKSTSPEPSTTEEATTSEATPAGSGTSTPRTNPHFVRSRFLKAKREAMDTNAINKVSGTPSEAVFLKSTELTRAGRFSCSRHKRCFINLHIAQRSNRFKNRPHLQINVVQIHVTFDRAQGCRTKTLILDPT